MEYCQSLLIKFIINKKLLFEFVLFDSNTAKCNRETNKTIILLIIYVNIVIINTTLNISMLICSVGIL